MPKGVKGFPSGKDNTGRPVGAVGKLTKTVKDTVLNTFNELQADDKTNLLAFAKKYPREFYQIAAKLIPTEVNANIQEKVYVVEIAEDEDNRDIQDN